MPPQPYAAPLPPQQRPTVSRRAIWVAALAGAVLVAGFVLITFPLVGRFRAQAELQRGTRLQQRGRTAEALAAFEKATELAPDNPHAWVALGIAAYELGDLKRSADAYRKALQLDQTLSVAHNNLAYVLYDEEQVDQAVQEWQKAIEYLPGSLADEQGRADCWAGLAIGYLAQGKREKAARTYARAVDINPNYLNTQWMATEAFWSPKAIAAADELIPLVRVRPAPLPEHSFPSA